MTNSKNKFSQNLLCYDNWYHNKPDLVVVLTQQDTVCLCKKSHQTSPLNLTNHGDFQAHEPEDRQYLPHQRLRTYPSSIDLSHHSRHLPLLSLGTRFLPQGDLISL